MLNMAWMKGSGSEVSRYFSEADYYIDNGNGIWAGKYKHLLGIPDKVDPKDLTAVLNNRTPTGNKITARDAAKRRTGLELTFSAPKSLSVLNAFGDERIRGAFDAAVAITMKHIEEHAERRLRAKGVNENITTGNLVYATFAHKLGRPVNGVPDPQMHSHVLLANCTYDSHTKKWYALEAGQIKTDAPYYQAFFRQTLAEQILALGYHLKPSKGDFEIEGVDKSILTKFSERRKVILKAAEELAERYNVTDKTMAKMGRMTREKKNDHFTWEDLQGIWFNRLEGGEYKQITDVYLRSRDSVFQFKDQSPHYTDMAIKHLTHKDTYTTERKVMTYALQKGIGRVSVEGIKQHINQMASDGWIRQKREPWKLTTKDAYQKNIEVKDLWKAGLGKYEKLGRDLYTVKAPGKPHLEALNKLYGSRDRFTSMRARLYKNPAMARAAVDLNAGIVTDLNNLPKEEVWFVSKVDDGDLPGLLKAAVEQDKRVVFWGDNQKSRLEEELRIEPLRLYHVPEPVKKASKRLKQAVLTLIQRSRDVTPHRDTGARETNRGRQAEYAR